MNCSFKAAITAVLVSMVATAVEPEPVLPLTNSPVEIFRQLVSGSQEQTHQILDEIGLNPLSQDSTVWNVQLIADSIVNSRDLNFLLSVNTGTIRGAMVIAKSGTAWAEVAGFTCSPYQQDPFVELKTIVGEDQKDVIVRCGGSLGTNVSEHGIEVYRAREDRMYRIFATIETREDLSGSERAKIEWPDPESNSGIRQIVVTRTKSRKGGKTTTRERYVWEPHRFEFVRSR